MSRLVLQLTAPIDPSDLEERAAVLAEGAGLGQADATDAAARELAGSSHAEFVSATIDRWREKIARLPAPASHAGSQLIAKAGAFLASPWAARAVAAGWDDLSLFAVHFRNPKRLDGMGLVPFVAWSVLKPTVVGLDAAGATLRTRMGARQTFYRFRLDTREAMPFWEHAGLIGYQQVAA